MIIDQVPLSGPDAYFRDATGDVNLAAAPGALARTSDLTEGHFLEVQGIRILLEAGDLTDLFALQENAMFSISVLKEVQPKLFADPYCHRMHTIGGFEDFRRGTLSGLRPLDVEGYPTLVSAGTSTGSWRSAVYQLPKLSTFDAMAWDLAATNLAPVGSFTYSLKIHYWLTGDALENPAPNQLALANNANPATPRIWNDTGAGISNVIAYQIEFEAKINTDGALLERRTRTDDPAIGRPLLRGVHLLESVRHAYAIYSLSELLDASSDNRLIEEAGATTRRLTACIDVSALLTEGEHIGVTVHTDRFDRFEARLIAEVQVRPPAANRDSA